MPEFTESVAARYPMKGNATLVLDDAGQCHLVHEGQFAVFAVGARDGLAEGKRHFLFDAGPGDMLMGFASRQVPGRYAVVAVSIEDAMLTTTAVDHPTSPIKAAHGHPQSEAWIRRISSVLRGKLPTAVPITLIAGNERALTVGQVAKPRQGEVIWVQVRAGRLRLSGMEGLPITPEAGAFPLGPEMWLEAEGDCTLVAFDTATAQASNDLHAGLLMLNHCFLVVVNQMRAEEDTVDYQRFQAKGALEHVVTRAAMEDLAGLMAHRDKSIPQDGGPLVMAMRAIGQAMGIDIKAGGSSEDMKRVKNPVEAIARASHIRFRDVLLTGLWYRQDNGPLLAKDDEGNPLALIPISGPAYDLYDPRTHTRTRVTPEVAARLDAQAQMFYRPLPEGKIDARDFARFALRGIGKDVWLIIGMGLVATLLGMLPPQVTGMLMDNAIPDNNRSLVLQMGLALFAGAWGVAIFNVCQGMLMLRIETRADATGQAAVWDRVLDLPAPFFRQYVVGDLNARVAGIGQIRIQLSATTLRTLLSGSFALFNILLMAYYSVQLALLGLAITALAVLLSTGHGLLKYVINRRDIYDDNAGVMVQLINGVTKLRVAGAEKRAFTHWAAAYVRKQKFAIDMHRVEDSNTIINELMPTLASMLLFWFVVSQGLITLPGVKAVAGVTTITTGTFLSYNAAFALFLMGATQLSNAVVNSLQIIRLWSRAKPILNAVPEVDSSKADPGRLTGRVQVDSVTFRYREDGPAILDGISIYADPGESIALVGPSGCGKSTLLRMLLGFETPESGSVYFDGQDLNKVDLRAVRRQLGVVLQNGKVTQGSLFDNIAGGAMVTRAEAWEAARKSGFEADIHNMAMGMETIVSEGGSNMSGGQRQRLLLCRAFVLNPQIMFFDEATSALDNTTQAIVSESLGRLKITSIVIAHRLSTIRNCDRIYVLRGGKVEQAGSFDELANQPGLFQEMMARQMA